MKSNPTSERKELPPLSPATGSPSSNLKSLLEKITLLPWNDSEGTFFAIAILPDSRTYAAHAANVMPEMVSAFSGLNLKCLMRIPESTMPPCGKCPTCIARAALSKAKMENDRS